MSQSRKTANGMHLSRDDPNLIRSLIVSTPLHEAPATAVVAESAADKAAASPSTRTSDSPSGGAWNMHLAQLLHSMYLVTFTEKAQLGAMYGRNSATAAVGTSAPSSASVTHEKVDIPVCSHSITVEERWLDAVTRYCHFTVSLDDVARVAMVFPALLQVRWSMEARDRCATDTAVNDGVAEQQPQRVNTAASSSESAHQDDAAQIPLMGGKLVARVYLRESRVVSIDEASEQLTELLRKKGSASAQRVWKSLVNHHTAYAAYLDGWRSIHVSSTAASTSVEDASHHTQQHDKEGPFRSDRESNPHTDPHDDVITDEALCVTLSAELRASLSAAKLQALLRQMRKDALHVEEAEQQRIAQRQLQERMLNAYEHVRALFGRKDTRGWSARALLTALQEESRFEDALDIKALLSSLLAIPASGLSATMLRESRVVAEAAPLQPASAPVKGVTSRGKRKRAGEEAAEQQQRKNSHTSDANPPVVVRVVEPSLEPVTDLRSLTDAELELVLIALDRAKGSVTGVLEATAYKAA